VCIAGEKHTKWDEKSNECTFMGYCETVKGYRLFDPENLCILFMQEM
jgi:hypothetical protein